MCKNTFPNAQFVKLTCAMEVHGLFGGAVGEGGRQHDGD